MTVRCCPLHLIKQIGLWKMFLRFQVLVSGISKPVFPSRSNLKLHNIYVTHKFVKKVIAGLDSSKVSGPACIALVVLKNCDLELSYTLAELFNIYV